MTPFSLHNVTTLDFASEKVGRLGFKTPPMTWSLGIGGGWRQN